PSTTHPTPYPTPFRSDSKCLNWLTTPRPLSSPRPLTSTPSRRLRRTPLTISLSRLVKNDSTRPCKNGFSSATPPLLLAFRNYARSEEHTSELQSRENL